MERYTYFDGGKWRIKIGDTEYSGKAVDRLAAYEETGLEPEEIISAAYTAKIAYVLHELNAYMARIVCALHELNAYKELGPIDRLRELIQADREGRVKILPKAEKRTCGACENFNRTPGKRSGTCSAREWYADKYGSVDKKRGRFTPSQSRLACKQYIDREEAEAALRREQDDN